VIGWLIFVAIGQLAVWNEKIIPDTHGESIPWMVTVSMGIVTALTLLTWLLFFPPFKRKLAVPLAIVIYLCTVGVVVGSIRKIDFNGDMKPTVTFRWEPTLEERLQAFKVDSGAAEKTIEVIDWTPQADDAPDWRGPARDGVVTAAAFSDEWSKESLKELWRRPCGPGYSPFVIVGPAAVTLEQRGANEAIVCYDADSGAERWTCEYPANFFEAMGGAGPRAAPVIAGNEVFTVGALGDLYCVDVSTGEPRWNVNILTSNGLERDGTPLNTVWAMSSAPLVVADLVIVNAGGPVGNGLVAYHRQDGSVVWKGGGLRQVIVSPDSINRAGYSSPELVTLGGVQQVLIFDGVGLRSCSLENGDELWFHSFEHGDSPGRVNVAQPLVIGEDRVFISASYTRGCDMLRVKHNADGTWADPESVWDDKVKKNMRSKFSSPVLHDGYLYGLDEGFLTCLDVETGQRKWKRDRRTQYGHGQMLLANNRIVLLSEYGELALIDPSPEGLRELAKIPLLSGEKTWNPPALAHGRAYLRNHLEAVCVELPKP
jgi:outer membrane protein assembly factor BamB